MRAIDVMEVMEVMVTNVDVMDVIGAMDTVDRHQHAWVIGEDSCMVLLHTRLAST